ncbi:CDP-glycerol glycerophosphotransferase family protein [Tabrizicola soli]|uniref:CDP-glycerol glycerophosphotransferase family protein n=1 Tax=Tabrizicola soli TaxID=2185115 RepID=A0ABV7DYJ5_9RHOB|nr:CDP-glycerol glycerophosphotransferase family protein [Tabrizicola soli]
MTFAASLVRALAYLAARVLPKSRTAVLRGFPPYEDNLLAVYAALEGRPVKRVIWVVQYPAVLPPVPLRAGTRLVRKRSVWDIYYALTAKYLFITHGHFLRRTPPNQISVNLWHGIPFKAIGRTVGQEGREDSYLVATSAFTRDILAEAFGMPPEQIILTGQARTDRMLSVDRAEIWRRTFPDRPLPRKILLWLPTFRQTPYAAGQSDGAIFGNVFNCSNFSEETFNRILSDHDAVCLVKPHPMAAHQSHTNRSNLHFMDEAWLARQGLSLYQLTGAADALISDISSIIADFMLMDRPIVLLFEDIALYEESRGFSFNPITEFLPAEVARSFESFLDELRPVLAGEDPYAARRAKLKKLFFDHSDAGAAARILDCVMGESH